MGLAVPTRLGLATPRALATLAWLCACSDDVPVRDGTDAAMDAAAPAAMDAATATTTFEAGVDSATATTILDSALPLELDDAAIDAFPIDDTLLWQPIDPESVARPTLEPSAVDARGETVTARVEGGTRIVVERQQSDSVVIISSYASESRVRDLALALNGDATLLAATVEHHDSYDLILLRLDADGSWQAGRVLDADPQSEIGRISLDVADGVVAVAWSEHDGYSYNVYVARGSFGQMQILGHALDLDIDAPADFASVAFSDGELYVAWNELGTAGQRALCARWNGGRWEALGGALGVALGMPSMPRLVEDDGLVVTYLVGADTTSKLRAARLNPNVSLPFGLPSQRPTTSCALPEESSPDFPLLLSETQCFEDLQTRAPAAGVVPYSLNSALWSDGAAKRRFVVLPDDERLGYLDEGSLLVPAGTILIKEFLIDEITGDPSTRRIMETRLLIKRCQPGGCAFPWQGYSYRWDADGTDARLLDNKNDSELAQWDTARGPHTHVYPGRNQCIQCHGIGAGSVLGLKVGQLNKNHDYGEVVDNQLRAWRNAGMLDAAPETPAAELPRLPTPADASFGLEPRTRAYFHANCAHCHNPSGSWPVIDFRYQTPLSDNNICNTLSVGDPAGSLLYQKDSTREPNLPVGFVGNQMPPLATLITDDRQLVRTRTWIATMGSCP